jgi:16S rRNA (adenine1518-N6/adenine1519-N6)-dimethyltransferase
MYAQLKKKYGQNFLIDKNIINKICNLIPNDFLNILEIGPGDGRLTENILKFNPKKLEIIEIDPNLIPILNIKFQNLQNIKIINNDILKSDLSDKVDLIISNLPYNISSQIMVKICLMKYLPKNLILMFQKEFAQRLLDKKLNSLNSLVNCFYEINYNFNISKNCFRPIPKIDSSVLFFSKKKDAFLKNNEIARYIEFKRSLFSFKRKKLGNLLKKYNFEKNNYNLNERVEDLSLQKLLEIFRIINP